MGEQGADANGYCDAEKPCPEGIDPQICPCEEGRARDPVSYTHLDVYKRQAQCRALAGNEQIALSSGVRKKRVEGIATIVCSAFIAASSLLSVSRGGGVTPQSGLTSMSAVFSAMSGVFIANAMSSYISQPIGIIVGNYTMSLIVYGLIACNLPSQLTTTVNGGFLLILLLVIEVKKAHEAERVRRAAVALQSAQTPA